ncbi:MAG: hypothetical protein JST04_18070 [Bdellovibrionales bacterium]|nr:hypothetical protein [Bdellovibrionales bacterium]
MRLAFSLSGAFLVRYLRTYGKYFVHGYLLTILLVVAKVAPKDLLAFLWMIFPIGFAAGYSTLMYSRNMGWIVGLPISRVALVISTVATTLALFGLAEIASLPSVYVLSGAAEFFAAIDNKREFLASLINALGKGPAISFGVAGILSAILVGLFVVLIAFPTNHLQLQARRMGRRGQNLTWRKAGQSFAWVFGLWFIIAEFGSPLLTFLLGIGVVGCLLFFSFDQTFGLPPRRRARHRNILAAAWVGISLASVVLIRVQAGSDDRARAFAAQEMLPDGMAGISDERFARFASAAKDVKELKAVLKAWQRERYFGKKIPYGLTKDLFDRSDFLPELFRHVEGREIPARYFSALATSNATEGFGEPADLRRLIRSGGLARDFSEDEIETFLNSGNPRLREFAVDWLGLRPKREHAERIVRLYRIPPVELRGLDLERERMHALEVVSEMVFREFGYAELFGPRSSVAWDKIAVPADGSECEKCAPKLEGKANVSLEDCSDFRWRACGRAKRSGEIAEGKHPDE